MANGNTGFLEQFGLTGATREEQELNRRTEALQQASLGAAQRTRGLDEGQQIAGRAGSLLGTALGGAGQLSNPEAARTDAVQAAQKRMADAQASNPALAGIQGEAKQNVFQQVLADELGKRGEVQLALQIGADLEQKRRQQKTQELELERLGIARDKDEQTIESNRNSLARDRRGEVTTVFPKGSQDPNSGQTAFIQNDGTAITPDGNQLPLGQYTIVRPVVNKTGRNLTANELGISDKESRSIRDQASAVMAQARGATQMADVLSEAAATGSINIMDGTGAITAGTDKMLSILSGIGRQIGATVDVVNDAGQSQGVLANGGAANAYVKKNFDELDTRMLDLVPENIRGDARLRAQYYSALTRITYSQARAQEPGARQLSDNDFKNALAVMAGNASDPEAFRRVMIGNMDENIAAFDDKREMIGDDVMRLIIKPKGMDRFNKTMEQFSTRFGQDFGTAAAPGPGLLGEPEAGGTEQIGGATVTFK